MRDPQSPSHGRVDRDSITPPPKKKQKNKKTSSQANRPTQQGVEWRVRILKLVGGRGKKEERGFWREITKKGMSRERHKEEKNDQLFDGE